MSLKTKLTAWKAKKRAAAVATLKNDYISWRYCEPPEWLIFIQAYGRLISLLASIPLSALIALVTCLLLK